MKKTFIALALLGSAVGLGLYATRDRHIPAAPAERPPTQVASTTSLPEPLPVAAPQTESPRSTVPEKSTVAKASGEKATSPGSIIFNQEIETLVSPATSFEQKQASWAKLRASGKLDQAITALEERMSRSPGVAELPAVLGQAYLQKAGSIQDIREQGILGMKADQTFEAALQSDSQNWEARFWKSTAMSYWPPQLGKGKEVIENCLELLKQQEVQPPKPEYAQVYVLLGEMYEREGYAEYAQQAWKRGLTLFPNHTALAGKAAGSASPDPN